MNCDLLKEDLEDLEELDYLELYNGIHYCMLGWLGAKAGKDSAQREYIYDEIWEAVCDRYNYAGNITFNTITAQNDKSSFEGEAARATRMKTWIVDKLCG